MPTAGNYGAPLLAAVENGSVPMAYINDHVARILNEMFVHGLFQHRTPAPCPRASPRLRMCS